MLILKKLRLFHLASSNLPIGSFAYSQGLESAVEKRWINNKNDFYTWQYNQIVHTLVYVDWPILKRLYQSCIKNKKDTFHYWVKFLLANRETSELRLEELQKGKALFALINESIMSVDNTWHSLLKKSQLAGLAWIGVKWKLSLKDILLSFAYSWLENSILVGMKVVPFGHRTAQRFLKIFCSTLAKKLNTALLLKDKNLGSSIPLASIASSYHEIQYSRLFRS